jgi:hypothetical protein
MKPHRVVLLASVACLVDAIARAQPPADLSIQVGECIALESAAERHACFDRQVEAALKADAGAVDAEDAPAGAVDTVPAPGGAETEAAPAPAGPAAATSATDTSEPPPVPEPIVSSIAALSQLRPNQYLIELENGQAWRQVTTQRYALRVGRAVTISATRWGDTYRLQTADASDYIQVERVR